MKLAIRRGMTSVRTCGLPQRTFADIRSIEVATGNKSFNLESFEQNVENDTHTRQTVFIDYINEANQVTSEGTINRIRNRITDRISRQPGRSLHIRCHEIDRKIGGAY